MEKRLNFHREVDDLTKINEFFESSQNTKKEEFIQYPKRQQVQIEPLKSAS